MALDLLWAKTKQNIKWLNRKRYMLHRIMFFVTNVRLRWRLRWSRGSVLAFGTQVRGFTPGRSRRIFRAKNSLALLPSEEK
jgi:hypothetical protein